MVIWHDSFVHRVSSDFRIFIFNAGAKARNLL